MSESNNNVPMRITQLEEMTPFDYESYLAAAKAGTGTKKVQGSTLLAELIDIRQGADGTTYPSAGDAVRTQMNKVNEKIDELNNNFWEKTYNLIDSHNVDFWKQGLIPSNANFDAWCIHTPKIFLKTDTSYKFWSDKVTNGMFRRIRIYDSSDSLLDTIDLGGVVADTYYSFSIDSETYPTYDHIYLFWGPFTGTYTPSDLIDDNINIMIYEGNDNKSYISYYVMSPSTAIYKQDTNNLLDVATYTDGVLYSDGSIATAQNWRTTDILELKESKEILYFKFGYPAFRYMFYNSIKQPMSSTYQSITKYGTIVSIVENAKYIRVSYVNDGSSSYNYNYQFISYNNYYDDYNKEVLNANPLFNKYIMELSGFSSVRVVDWTGKGMYKTISEAVENAIDGDVIIVMPGVYNESVKPKNKTVSIIGIDKQSCILQNNYADYNNPPLWQTNGVLKNMTLKCLSNGSTPQTLPYCIHMDNSFSSGVRKFEIENCDFISDYGDCVGCGTANNHNLIIKNCNFENTGNSNRYPFAYHNTTSNTTAKLRIENCHMINNGSGAYCIYLYDYTSAESLVDVELIGNTAKSVVNGVTDANFVLNANNSNKFSLVNTSHGNNIVSMNA